MNRRRIKALVAAAGIVGVLLSVVGFYAGNAPDFPRIQKVLSPACYADKRAIAFLTAHQSIDSSNPDFPALADLIEAKLFAFNPNVPRAKIKLESVTVTGTAIVFGRVAPALGSQVEMRFSGAKPVRDNFAPYKKAAEALCESTNLSWSVWAFWIGALLAFVSILSALFTD